MKGVRKIAFGAVAFAFLAGGLALTALAPSTQISYGAFATAVVSITLGVVVGNVGEHFAAKKEPAP